MEFTPVTKSVEMIGIDEMQDMSIAASGKMFYTIISGLYSRKIESIVRESIANAKDGHIARGNTDRPSSVHAPTRWEPYYSVRDYGCSMDHETVVNRFTVIGWSSKEKTNDQIGTFGLGSKAPFAYTSQFTVTCWLDGERRVYNCHLTEDGKPRIALMDRAPSDEEQGLMVRFDVKEGDIPAFHKAIHYVGLAHQPCFECNLDGVRSANVITDYGAFYRTDDAEGPLVQIGCVWYKIDFSALDHHLTWKHLKEDKTLVVRTAIGELGIVPSREGLEYTPKTIKALTDRLNGLYKQIEDEVAAEVAALGSVWEAAAYMNDLGPGLKRFIASEQKTAWGRLSWLTKYQFRPATERHIRQITITNSAKVLSSTSKRHECDRGGDVAVYVRDMKQDAPKTMQRRVAADLVARGFHFGLILTKPDPHGEVRAAVKEMEALKVVRKERKIKLDGIFQQLTKERAAVENAIAEFGCPVVVDVSTLPDPPKLERQRHTTYAIYRMMEQGSFYSEFNHKNIEAVLNKVNIVLPLTRGEFVPRVGRSTLRNIAAHYGHDLGTIVGVAKSYLGSFLKDHPEFVDYRDIFNEKVMDPKALADRAHKVAHSRMWRGSQHTRFVERLRLKVVERMRAPPQVIADVIRAHAEGMAEMRRYEADRNNLMAQGLSLGECQMALKLLGAKTEGIAERIEEITIDGVVRKVGKVYPALEQLINWHADIDPVVYILGVDAKREHDALMFTESLDVAAQQR